MHALAGKYPVPKSKLVKKTGNKPFDVVVDKFLAGISKPKLFITFCKTCAYQKAYNFGISMCWVVD
jgi:hypothetical protein